eukprot:IDg1439t1
MVLGCLHGGYAVLGTHHFGQGQYAKLLLLGGVISCRSYMIATQTKQTSTTIGAFVCSFIKLSQQWRKENKRLR